MTVDVAAATLFAQMLGTVANFTSELAKRKNAKESKRLYAAIRNIDPENIYESVDSIQLANLMTSEVTAEKVSRLFELAEFKGAVNELLLVCLTEKGQSNNLDIVEQSIKILCQQNLSANSASGAAGNFAEGLAKKLIQLSRRVLEELENIDESLSINLQQAFLQKRMWSVIDTIPAHNKALKRTMTPSRIVALNQFKEGYRRSCVERHGYISPPDFETNRKIPIETLYVAPAIKEISSKQYQPSISLGNFKTTIDRSVILGDPGGGKSTLSGYITANYARDPNGPVPFHVTLRDFAPHSSGMSLLEYIEREIAPKYQIRAAPGMVEDLFLTGSAIAILDGLDELIDATMRREVSRCVELFGIQYPHCPILVTSRRVGYEQARLDPAIYDTYLIDSFGDSQVEEYVHKWFNSQEDFNEQQAEELAASFIGQSMAVQDLRSNPLMLALMCIIFRGDKYIPRNRPDIYDKCATLLFDKWDGHRGIIVPLQARDHVDAAMKYIAYEFLTSGSTDTGVPRNRVIAMLAEYLYPRAVENNNDAILAAEEFVDYCSGRAWVFTDAGATGEGEPIFTFTHRTFMEYFAAVHLTRISDSPEKLGRELLPRIAREEWDVVAQLAVQQVDRKTDKGTERCLGAMLHEKRRRSIENRGNILTFIARCLSFAIISPALVRDITSKCMQYSRSHFDIEASSGSTDPLFVLQRSTSALVADAAVRQVGEELTALVAKPEQSSNTLRIVYAWMVEFVVLELIDHPTDDAWTELVAEFSKKHLPEVLEQAEDDPILPAVLAWLNIVSADFACEMIRKSGDGFFDRYFASPSKAIHRSPIRSLSALLMHIAQLDTGRQSENRQEFVRVLFDDFILAFNSGSRELPDYDQLSSMLNGHILFVGNILGKDLTEIGADVLLVAGMGHAELTMFSSPDIEAARLRRVTARSNGVMADDRGTVGDYQQCSFEIGEFARRWAQNEVSIFSNLESVLDNASSLSQSG